MICPNLNDPEVRRNFDQLQDALGPTLAGLVYSRNGGNFMDKTPTGEDSKLFQNLLEVTRSVYSAIKIKAQYFTDAYQSENNWLESGNEPDFSIEAIGENLSKIQSNASIRLQTQEKIEREYKAPTTTVNNTKIAKPSNVRNPNIKSALTDVIKSDESGNERVAKVYSDEIDSPNKRYITNKYFRLSNNKPYYPFAMGNISSTLKRVELINAEFGSKVVVFDPSTETIKFSSSVDQASPSSDITSVESLAMEEFLNPENEIEDDVYNAEALAAGEIKLRAFEEVVGRRKGLKDLLFKRLSEKTGRRSEIQAKIDILDDQIEKLENDKVNSTVIEVANQDRAQIQIRLDNISSNLYKDLNEDQLWDMMADLQEIGAYVKGWEGMSEFMESASIEDEATKAKVNLLQGQFTEIHNVYVDLLKKSLLEYSNKVSYKKFVGEDLFSALADESQIRRFALGASMSSIELVKIVQDRISEAAFKVNNESLDKDRELNDWISKLKKHSGVKSENEISEKFHQLTKDGKWTGRLIGKISQEYFDERRSLRLTAKNSGSKEDWAKYFNFLKDNTYEMTEEEYNKRSSSRKFSNGKDIFSEEDFKKQDKLIEKYNKRKEAYRQEIINSGKFGNTDGTTFISEDIENQFLLVMDEWDKRFNPWYHEPGRDRNPFRMYRSTDKIDSKWFDKRFSVIENDPLMLGFYNFYKERTKENDSYLPEYNKEQSNQLFGVKKTFAEDFADNKGFSKTIGLLRDGIVKTITAESHSENEGRVVIGGKVYKNIPTGGLHADIDVDSRSKNIFKALKAHTDLATGYKYKSDVEPIANAAQDILDEMEMAMPVNTKTGEIFKKKNGQTITQKGALFNARARLQYLTSASLYGEAKEEYDTHGSAPSVDGKERGYSFGKTIDSLIKFTYLKSLSFPNVMSPTVNLILGTATNFTYAAGGVDFDDASLGKAYWKIKSAISRKVGKLTNSKDAEQTMAWLLRLGVLPDLNSAAYEDSQSWDKLLTILQSKGELINQGATMLAYLMHNKLKDKNGKDVSIIDAYNVKDGQLIWNVEKMGEQSQPDSNEIISKDGHGVNMFRLSNKIIGINKHLHGDYMSPLEIKKTAAGRALSLFKTWIGATIEHRFGAERFDPDLMIDVKGRYRSLFSAQTKEGVLLTYKQTIPLLMKGIFSKKSFDILSDTDKVNLKRNLREIQIMTVLATATLLLMAALDEGDDDDPIYKKSLNLMVNLVSKTQSDMGFYMNPLSMAQVTDNAIPLIATMTDFVKIFTTLTDTILGDGVYESGPFKDEYKTGVAIGRAFPGTSGMVKMWNYASQQYDYN